MLIPEFFQRTFVEYFLRRKKTRLLFRQNPRLIGALANLLHSEPLFSKIIISNRVLDRLIHRDELYDFLSGKQDFVERFFNAPGVVEVLSLDPKKTTRFLEESSFRHFILTNESFWKEVTGDREIFIAFLRSHGIFEKILEKKEILISAISDDVIRRLAIDHGILVEERITQILSNDELSYCISRFLKDPQVTYVTRKLTLEEVTEDKPSLDSFLRKEIVLNHIVSSLDILYQIISSQQALDIILDNEDCLSVLAEHPRFVEALTTNDSSLNQILSSETVFGKLISDARFLEKIIRSEEVLQALSREEFVIGDLLRRPNVMDQILSDQAFLGEVVEDQRGFEQVLRNDLLLSRLLQETKVFEILTTKDAIFLRLLSDERVFNRIVSDDVFISRILNEDRVLERISHDPIWLDRVINIPVVFDRILSNDGLLKKILDEEKIFRLVLDNDRLLARFAAHPRVLQTLLTEESSLSRILTDERSFSFLLSEEPLLTRLLQHPSVLHRISTDPAWVQQFINLPTVSRQILSDPVLLEQILGGPQGFETIVNSRRLLSELFDNHRFLERVLESGSLLPHLLSRKETLDQIVSNKTLARSLLGSNRILEELASDPTLFERFLTTPPVLNQVLADSRLLDRLLDNPKTLKAIVGNDLLIGKLVEDPRVLERILWNDSALIKILSNGKVLDRIAGDEVLLTRLLAMDRVLENLATDENLFREFLKRPTVRARIVSDDETIKHLLKFPKVRDYCTKIPGLLERFLQDEKAIEKEDVYKRLARSFADHAGFIHEIASSQTFLDTFLEDEEIRSKVLRHPKFSQSLATDESFLGEFTSSLVKDLNPVSYERVLAVIEFDRKWRQLKPHLKKPTARIQAGLRRARKEISSRESVPVTLLDIICNGRKIPLRHGTFEFPDRRSLWILINEILFNEEYYFKTESETPLIVDCGVHCGLSVYYFKTLYPMARIIGFEPVPYLRSLAVKNLKRCHFSDVRILPYAVGPTDEGVTFYYYDRDSMAGSERPRTNENEYHTFQVQQKRLSRYLKNKKVHCLKLDIEGTECEVLTEVAPFLGNVRCLFCEYHYQPGNSTNSLPKIISILEECGFAVQVSKSFSYYMRTHKKPFEFLGNQYSVSIAARR